MAASGPISLGSTRRSKSRETTNKRIEHLVIGIICTYTICWLPYWITQLCVSFTTLEHSPVEGFYSFVLIATCLSYTNSALNPILYAFLSDNFKRRCSDVFRSIYSIKWCQRTQCTESHSTVTTACYESEAGRPESRQTVMLNESIRLITSSNQCNDSTVDTNQSLATLARTTLDPIRNYPRAHCLEHDNTSLTISNNNNNNKITSNNNPDVGNSGGEPRKKSVAFSVDTIVVQGLNNETMKSNHHTILQADKTSQSHGV